jgi:hypothetical protein
MSDPRHDWWDLRLPPPFIMEDRMQEHMGTWLWRTLPSRPS